MRWSATTGRWSTPPGGATEDAFARLYAAHHPPIYRYALHMCGAATADDIVQDTFLALLRQTNRFDPARGTLLAYLCGIARHHTSQAPASFSEVSTAFLPLIYSSVPITNGQLVRLQVPQAALASFGLAAGDGVALSSSETVLADVLVGEDGLARAVRFVRPSTTRKQQEQQP